VSDSASNCPLICRSRAAELRAGRKDKRFVIVDSVFNVRHLAWHQSATKLLGDPLRPVTCWIHPWLNIEPQLLSAQRRDVHEQKGIPHQARLSTVRH
jgi:hypothetical protein